MGGQSSTISDRPDPLHIFRTPGNDISLRFLVYGALCTDLLGTDQVQHQFLETLYSGSEAHLEAMRILYDQYASSDGIGHASCMA